MHMQHAVGAFGSTGRAGVLVAFLSVILLAAPFATAGQQTASIVGQATDENGGVLPGVTVTAASPALQLRELTVVTDAQGEYRLMQLPIGTYEVTYTLAGFQPLTREGVRLTVDFAAKLDVIMKIGELRETITVTGSSPMVDTTSSGLATTLTRETLEVIPTSRSGLISLLAQTPGVRTTLDFAGSGMVDVPRFHAFGQEGESWQMLEGVLTASPKSGTQSAQFWDYSAFEEARIATMGHGAAIPNRGIAVNVIIKSGSNNFHGSGSWGHISPKFQNNNLDAALAAQGVRSGNPLKTRWDRGADLGGRILRDKLWFYSNLRYRKTANYIVNAFRPDSSPSTLGDNAEYYTQKLSYQMNRSNRIDASNQYGARQNRTGGSEFTSYESRIDFDSSQWVSKVEWQSVISDSLFTSLLVGRRTFFVSRFGYSDQVATFDQITQVRTGRGSSAGDRAREQRYQTTGTVNWYRPNVLGGNHQITLGFDYMPEMQGRWFNRIEPRNYELIFRNGVPFQLITFDFDIATPVERGNRFDIYVQDSWAIKRRLTLNLGLRYAHDNGFLPEQCRYATGPPRNIVTLPAACYPRVQYNVWNPVTPRLNAAYEVGGDGKTVIKGGWARYAHRRQLDEMAGANKTAATLTTYNWHDINGNKQYDPGEVDLSPNGRDFVATNLLTGGALSSDVPNPNEKEPMSDEFSLSLERVLASNFAVRGTGVYSRNTNVYRVQNNKRPYSVYNIPVTTRDPGPDGRVGTTDDPGTSITYFDYPAAYAGAAFQEIMLVNDPNATDSYKSFEIAATKRMSNRWQLMASFSETKKHLPFVSNVGGGLGFGGSTFDPNAEIFSADNTWEWQGKVSGSYSFPAGILGSANFEHRSGEPYARTVSASGGQQIRSLTVRVEPIGTRRRPNLNLLDFRVEKAIRLPAGQKVVARLNLYNVTNTNAVINLNTLSGPNFLRPSSIVPPRTFELGAVYSF